jgi:hypothetical protein
MSKIYAFLAIDAVAKFSIDKPSDWDDMSYEDKIIYFLNCCDPAFNVCTCNSYCVSLAREFNLDSDLAVNFEESS